MADRETFTLSELTEDFFRTLCYVERQRSSGLGGPGYILMITETGQEYFLGEEGYDELKAQDIVPLLTAGGEWNEEEHRSIYCAENNGWTYVADFATDVLVRNDLYKKINALYYETEHRKLEYGDCYSLLQCVLKSKDGGQRKVYIKTQENRDKEEMERRKAEENRKRIALTAKDIEWKPLYVNNRLDNSIEGTYGFLFKKQKNGEIAGYKWTIVFQYEEIEHGREKMEAPIEAYNLYFKEYKGVTGVMGYREPGYTYLQCYEKSTIRDGIHSYGKFVRSYKALELAKEAVLYRNECIGWGNVNLENIVKVSLDKRSIAEMQKDYMAKIKEHAHINIKTDITFRELRNYLSVLERLSICILETSDYNNYICLEDVPHFYDDYYVYGVGMIESEFYKINKCEYAASGDRKDLALVNCIEVMLSQEPKSVLIKRYREEKYKRRSAGE